MYVQQLDWQIVIIVRVIEVRLQHYLLQVYNMDRT